MTGVVRVKAFLQILGKTNVMTIWGTDRAQNVNVIKPIHSSFPPPFSGLPSRSPRPMRLISARLRAPRYGEAAFTLRSALYRNR